jgi:hypothetical protein
MNIQLERRTLRRTNQRQGPSALVLEKVRILQCGSCHVNLLNLTNITHVLARRCGALRPTRSL